MKDAEEPGTAVAATDRGRRDVARVGALEENLLALAKGPEERAAAFRLAAGARQSAMVRAAATEIAGTGWGKELSPVARAAVARYALSVGTDPVRHWQVLGGKLYDLAELWLDLASSMPDYLNNTREYINKDERVSSEENARRRELRGKWNTPEDAAGICLVTIHRNGKPDVTEVNWAGNRGGFNAKTGSESGTKDPIGQQEPGKTSFTRAFRRAAKQCWPLWFQKHPLRGEEDGGVDVGGLRLEAEDVIAGEREHLRLHPAEPSKAVDLGAGVTATPGSGAGVTSPADPYASEDDELDTVCLDCGAVGRVQVVGPTDDLPKCPECNAQMAASSDFNDRVARMAKLLKHQCFTEDDRKLQKKWLQKAHPDIKILDQRLADMERRVAEWDKPTTGA